MGASSYQQKSSSTAEEVKNLTVSALLLGLVVFILLSVDGDPPLVGARAPDSNGFKNRRPFRRP